MIILNKFDNERDYFNYKALRYAEIYGIFEYNVVYEFMLYSECYPNEGYYLHKVNLITNEHECIQSITPSEYRRELLFPNERAN